MHQVGIEGGRYGIGRVIVSGEELSVRKITIEAVSTYSATLEHLHYHLKERMDYDYVLTLGRKCIYIARNTEDDEDVLVLKDIVFFSESTIHNEL